MATSVQVWLETTLCVIPYSRRSLLLQRSPEFMKHAFKNPISAHRGSTSGEGGAG